MSTYINRLLIGGIRAGEIVRVDIDADRVTMPAIYSLNEKKIFDVKFGHEPVAWKIPISHYRLEKFHCNKKVYEAFVADGVNPMEELLNGYRPIVAMEV